MNENDSGDLFTLRRSDVDFITFADKNVLALYVFMQMNTNASDDELMTMLELNEKELYFAKLALEQRLKYAEEIREYDEQ
jgi:hypothetical protein